MLRRYLLALALLLFLPMSAFAANCGVVGGNLCFWVGSTGNWSDAAHWSTTSGGGGGTGPPTTTNVVAFDSNSTGTATIDVDVNLGTGTITNSGTYAGTFDNSANHSFTIGSWANSATGARTLNLGSGSTWTLTSTTSSAVWNDSSATGIVSYTPPGTILLSATATGRRGLTFFTAATATYGNITVTNASPSSQQITLPAASFSAANLTLTNAQNIAGGNSVTYTLSGALTATGTSASPCYLGTAIGTTTIQVGGASTITSCFIQNITRSGAGTLTANSSFDGGGNNTGPNFIINPPPSGGRCIGC